MAQYSNKYCLALTLLISCGALLGCSLPAQAQVLQNPLPDLRRPVEQVRDQVERRVQEQLLREARIDAQLADVVEVVELAADTTRKTLQAASGETLFVETTLANGDPVIEQEWLVTATPEIKAALEALDAEVLEQKSLLALGLELIRFRVAKHLDSRERLQAELPQQALLSLTRHFVYRAQNSVTDPASTVLSSRKLQQAKWCDAAVKIGMVDTKIMTEHGAFAHQPITQRTFTDSRLQQPIAHGTAVAGLLVGRHDNYQSLLPNAQLYNGAVFYRHNALQQGAALLPLLEALNWLAGADVNVVNVSLTGPASPLLATAVKKLAKQGVLLVAAAGNNGPLAPEVYPAAYQEVLAVTAVDAEGAVYRWANQGEYIDFASLGVRITTARRDGKTGYETGTSMAAPVVAAAAACWFASNAGASVAELRSYLKNTAKDLGETGHDVVFGHGLISSEK